MAAIDISAQPIRALGFADIAAACALNASVGWNQNAADWQVMLELGRGFAIDDAAGNLAATALTLPYYGGGFGWISMVLVAASYRRAGLATRLMQHCIGDLTAAGLVPVLDATPAGRPVYRALGFRSTSGMKRLSRQDGFVVDAAVAAEIRAIEAADWPTLRLFDAAAFGSDRGLLLQNLQQRQPALGLLAMRNGYIVGYLLGRDGRAATQLGPLVADDVDIAKALLARGLGAVSGRVYIDVADGHADLAAWLTGLGFQVERPLTRMVYERDTVFDDAARVFAVAGPELG